MSRQKFRKIVWSSCSPRYNNSLGRSSRPAAFAFSNTFAAETSYSVGSVLRARTAGRCARLFVISGSSISNFELSSDWEKCTHLSRMWPLSHNSPPSLPPMYCHSTFFVFPIDADLISWNDNRWPPTVQLNSVVLEKTNDCCTFTIFSQLQ